MSSHVLHCRCAGAQLMWGGRPLEGHSIPEVYGAMQPTAVFVPLDAMLESDANWELCNTELFGPFQVPRFLCCGSLPCLQQAASADLAPAPPSCRSAGTSSRLCSASSSLQHAPHLTSAADIKETGARRTPDAGSPCVMLQGA